jgi:hypothetical protein
MSDQIQPTPNDTSQGVNAHKLTLMLLLGISPHIEPLISMTAATWKSVVTSAVFSLVGMLVAYFSNPSSPISALPPVVKKQ